MHKATVREAKVTLLDAFLLSHTISTVAHAIGNTRFAYCTKDERSKPPLIAEMVVAANPIKPTARTDAFFPQFSNIEYRQEKAQSKTMPNKLISGKTESRERYIRIAEHITTISNSGIFLFFCWFVISVVLFTKNSSKFDGVIVSKTY